MDNWILCSDQLPDNDCTCILSVIDDAGDSEFCFVCTGWYIPEINKWVIDDSLSNNVIAWMPLPEPYERPLVKCIDCRYRELHDFDGICGKDGSIISPWHSCRKGKNR